MQPQEQRCAVRMCTQRIGILLVRCCRNFSPADIGFWVAQWA
jgi:hypothetical protein